MAVFIAPRRMRQKPPLAVVHTHASTAMLLYRLFFCVGFLSTRVPPRPRGDGGSASTAARWGRTCRRRSSSFAAGQAPPWKSVAKNEHQFRGGSGLWEGSACAVSPIAHTAPVIKATTSGSKEPGSMPASRASPSRSGAMACSSAGSGTLQAGKGQSKEKGGEGVSEVPRRKKEEGGTERQRTRDGQRRRPWCCAATCRAATQSDPRWR